ncbi:MAG: NADPH-dependent F420 reductase [Mycobacterium sp.]
MTHDDGLDELTIGVLGGTGAQGRGLALRLAQGGLSVVLGSRDARRAQVAADALYESISGTDNATCAQQSDIVIVAVPYDGHRDLLVELAPHLRGKIVVDCVNALAFDKQGAYPIHVAAGSAAQEAAAALPDSTVVGAFHNVSAVVLLDETIESVGSDVLVLGDVREATDAVIALAGRISGVRGIFGGRLRNAYQVESLTANLIAINRRYKTHASISITGL